MDRSPVIPRMFSAALLTSAIVSAMDDLPAHESLLSGDYVDQVRVQSNEKGRAEVVPVVDQSFRRAVRITNLQRMSKFYDFQLIVPTGKAVKKGDIVLVRFYARGEAPMNEDGEAEAQVYFQKSSPKYQKHLSQRVTGGRTWKRYDYPFKVAQAYESGAAALCFGTGFNTQVIEIGGVQLLRFDRKTKLRDLPRMPLRYKGDEPDAPWRAEAAARIEKHRKADLVIRVTDAKGNAVPDAQIELTMTRHAFQFSSVVSVPLIAKGGADAEIYKAKLLELFNASGNENALKWPPWDGDWGRGHSRENTIGVLKWLKDNGLYVRGHVMVWPGWKNLPEAVKALKDTPEKIPDIVSSHIREIAASTSHCVDEWDVINETRTNHDLMDLLGRDIMIDWFKTAREALPDKDLYINDFSILNGGGPGTKTHETYKKTIKFLLDSGAPVTGIGFQGHVGSNLPDPARVVRILDDFAEFGLKMRVTEFDVNVADEDAQARFTRDFMTAVFSHPQIVGFQFWGFWEGAHWKPNGAMYRRDWEPKPNAHTYRDLVFKQWWTTAVGVTDADGAFQTRAFLGDYRIHVTGNGKTGTSTASLGRDSEPVQIVLK